MLYFSRSSVTPNVPGEIYVSERQNGARFGPATAVSELNDAAANDIQPNVRADGLEVVFSSNRAGTLGAQDIWIATRTTVGDSVVRARQRRLRWSTRAPRSRGRRSRRTGASSSSGARPGPREASDIYVTTR